MKYFVLILIALLSTATFAKQEDPVSAAALFVDGFLRGALAQDIGRVDSCLTDGDKIINDVDSLIKDVSKGFDLMSLVVDIGKLLTDVPSSISDCHELPDTVKDTFKAWGSKIKNPLVIGKIVFNALLKYRSQLEGDASNFLSQWKSGQFEAAGQSIGDIPHTLFDLCQPVTIDPFNVARFVDGFLRSSLQREIGEVDKCLTDADNLFDDIEKFVTDIESGFDLLKLITDLGSFLTDIPKSITECGDFVEAVEEVFGAWETEMKDPTTIAKIVYVALSQYQDRLKGDASQFVSEWKAGAFEHSGELLGDIPHVLFDMCPAEPSVFKNVKTMLSSN